MRVLITGIATFGLIIFSVSLLSQSVKRVVIKKSGGLYQDEKQFPGAKILFKVAQTPVQLQHEDMLVVSDKAYFYTEKNSFKAVGNVILTQPDSLRMVCNALDYDGEKRKMMAWGKVVLKKSDLVIETDTLYFDRDKQQAFYKTNSRIENKSSTLTSDEGIFFIEEDKYQFNSRVKIQKPDFIVDSERMDYYIKTDHAYLYGKTKIVADEYQISCRSGFYDTNAQRGYFKQDAVIFYDNKVIAADSLYFDNQLQFAAAERNINILDTLNKAIIRGHHGKIFKAKDSAIVTKRATALSISSRDTLYIHADTLLSLGRKEKDRVFKAYYGVRVFSHDVRGKSDSAHFNYSDGYVKLLKKPLLPAQQRVITSKEINYKNPVLWLKQSQMLGDTIFITLDEKTQDPKTLQIVGNAMVIQKDSLALNRYNQMKGAKLEGFFTKGALDIIELTKNTELIYHVYDEKSNSLIGINKVKCGAMQIDIEKNNINSILFLTNPEGSLYPEEQLPLREQKFNDFVWREKEQPKTIAQLYE